MSTGHIQPVSNDYNYYYYYYYYYYYFDSGPQWYLGFDAENKQLAKDEEVVEAKHHKHMGMGKKHGHMGMGHGMGHGVELHAESEHKGMGKGKGHMGMGKQQKEQKETSA